MPAAPEPYFGALLDLTQMVIHQVLADEQEKLDSVTRRIGAKRHARSAALLKAANGIPHLIQDWSERKLGRAWSQFREYDEWARENGESFFIWRFLDEAIAKRMVPEKCLKCEGRDFAVVGVGEWDGCDAEGNPDGGPIRTVECRNCHVVMVALEGRRHACYRDDLDWSIKDE